MRSSILVMGVSVVVVEVVAEVVVVFEPLVDSVDVEVLVSVAEVFVVG